MHLTEFKYSKMSHTPCWKIGTYFSKTRLYPRGYVPKFILSPLFQSRLCPGLIPFIIGLGVPVPILKSLKWVLSLREFFKRKSYPFTFVLSFVKKKNLAIHSSNQKSSLSCTTTKYGEDTVWIYTTQTWCFLMTFTPLWPESNIRHCL